MEWVLIIKVVYFWKVNFINSNLLLLLGSKSPGGSTHTHKKAFGKRKYSEFNDETEDQSQSNQNNSAYYDNLEKYRQKRKMFNESTAQSTSVMKITNDTNLNNFQNSNKIWR